MAVAQPKRLRLGRIVLAGVVAVGFVYLILQLQPADPLVQVFDGALHAADYSTQRVVLVPEISEFIPVGTTCEAACARLVSAGFSCSKANPGAVPSGFDERYVGYRIPWSGYKVFGYFEYVVVLDVRAEVVGSVRGQIEHTAL